MSDINLCNCEEYWCSFRNKNGKKYELSSKGRLYSFHYKRFIGCLNKKSNYVNSFNDIHRLVAKYFINYNIKNLHIDHINTIRNHNCICNLKIGTRKDNNNNPLTIIKYKRRINHMLGKKHSKESRKKMSSLAKKRKIKLIDCYLCCKKKLYHITYYKYHNGKCLFN